MKNKNCLNSKETQFKIHEFTRMEYDRCEMNKRKSESKGPGYYNLSNYYNCDCMSPNIKKVAYNQPNVHFKDGYGWVGMNGCTIDNDSNIRFKNGNKLTHFGSKNQLLQRPYLSVPYMGRGVGNPCIETELKPGEDTSQKKQCNVFVNDAFESVSYYIYS